MRTIGRKTKKPEVDPKWAASIGDQINVIDHVKNIDTKAVPLESIQFAGNPRELSVDPDEIRKNLDTLKLPPRALAAHTSEDWMDSYEEVVESVFKETAKQRDFLSIALFAASLKSADRLISPILVWREGGRFYKITGERRYLAHVLLGEQTIEAKIYDKKPSEFEISQLQWEENFQREDLCLHDALKNLESMVKGWQTLSGEESISVTQFQNISGMTRTTGSRYLKILTNATPRLWEAMKERHVDSLMQAYELAALPEGQIDKALSKFMKGETTTATDLRRQRAAEGKRTRKTKKATGYIPKVTNQTWVRRARQSDIKAMKAVVWMLRDSLKKEELTKELDKLEMDSGKDIDKAMQLIFETVKKTLVAPEK